MRQCIYILLFFCALNAHGQTYLDCAPLGPLIELQLNTEVANDKFFYSNGACIKGGVTNGGLELIAGTLSIIDGDTIGQVLRWTGTTWEPRLIIFHGGGGGVDTVYNGLTDRDTAFVLGGPLVEHTRVQGQKAYDITWDDMRTVYIEAQRTGGVAYSSLTMGSTAIQGVDFFHYNEATPAKQAVVGINYSSGNIMKLQETYDNGTYINQYDPGGGAFRTDIYAANAVYSQTFRLDRNGMYMLYPDITDVANEAAFLMIDTLTWKVSDITDVANEAAFLMIDTLTWKVLRKSPADFAGLYGDNWGTQVVQKTARFSGSGTTGSPLELAQQSATTGQVMKWNGTSWAPGTDAGASAANLTAASPKVAITGGTGAVLNAATVDVTEANLTLNNIGGTLGISKGGTGLTSVGANATILGSDGSAALWVAPNIVTDGVTTNFTRSGSALTVTVPPASFSAGGIVTTGTQTFSGAKIFSNFVNAGGGLYGQSTASFAAMDAGGVSDANYIVTTTSTTLDHTHNFVAIGTLTTNRTISLPACNSTRDGWEYRFLKIGSDIYTVTIDPNGSEAFTDGATTKVFDGQNSGAFCKCRWDGSVGTWFYSQTFAPSTVVTIPYGSTPTTGQVVKWNGTAWAPGADSANAPDSTFAKGSIGAPSYAGKTLGTAVFRTGRTGFKTANTTGVINISPGFGTSVPAISIPDSCDIILSVGADSRGDSISKFQITNRYVDNSTEVGDDNVFWAGFNTTSVGGKIASARASAAIGIKEKFDVSTNGILRPSYVVYAPFINLKTSGDRSPLSGFFGHEAAFGGAWTFNTDYLTFKDYKTATTKAIWGFGENGFTKGIDFVDTAQLRFNINNWNIFSQKKAGSGFVDVLKVNASDEIQIGGGGESGVMAYNKLRLSNSGILYNEFGELNIGTTANPTRLLIENNSSNLLTLTRTGGTYTNTFSIFGSQFYFQSSSSTVPFNVDLGAPSNSLVVRGSGLVGVGTFSPLAQLHVTSSAGTSTTKMLALENAAGTVNFFRTNVAPESAVTGGVSDVAFSNIAGDGKMYLKRSGTGNTGWGEVLTNTNGASGTNTYLPKFTAANTLSNSAIYDDGSASIVYPWGYGMKIQFSGSYNMGVKKGSGRDLELYAVSPDGDADITFKPGGGVAMTAKHDGKVGVGTTSPAQTFHVQGTARITGSDGTATTIAGRDGDGDISDVAFSTDFEMVSGELKIKEPGEAVYLGDNGATGETITWQPDDVNVDADPTAGHLTVELNGAMKTGVHYSLFGCCNLTYNIILSGTMKLTGQYGTVSSYTLTAGQHLEVIKLSDNSFRVSKK